MNRPLAALIAHLCACAVTCLAGDVPPLFAKAHPVLEQHCFPCHSHAASKSKGGLMLDSRESLLNGGDRGPAIVPGKPDESLLVQAVTHRHQELRMPHQERKLQESEILALVEWIQSGAPWPQLSEKGEAAGLARRRPGQITETDRNWWAFQPLKQVKPPEVRVTEAHAIRNDIDRFILSRLAAEGIAPSAEADASRLIRRVTFDLTGLPPTLAEVTAFLADTSPGAYERLVDRLLASPEYGQRMARHWLDLVRYADGDGYRADDYRPDAWRFRDYVIRSLNEDKAYTRFVEEQLAGDELYPGSTEAIIATGYLRHGIYEWNARDARGQWDTILNDLTDTTADVFLGMGVQCARCHDHKFDPILQRDYFRLRAFFAPIQPGDRVVATPDELAAHAARLRVWEEKTANLRAEIARLEQPYLDRAESNAVARFPDDIQAMIRKPVAERSPFEEQIAVLAWRQVIYDWERVDRTFKGEDKERILGLRRQLATLNKDKPAPLPVAFAASDVGRAAPPVFIPKKQSQGEIEPGILTVLDPSPMRIIPLEKTTGRRSALARWITATNNPLTARVIVNRVWQQHFGRGLAANPSDFGRLGEQPTHPELLDWLAGRFIQEGWSMKKLHRLVVTSATYRRSSQHPTPGPAKLKDPENRLLWRWVPRRLDAEQIRDAMLATSGEMVRTNSGPGVSPDLPHRTIFTRFMRNTRDPLADVFDAPLWFTSAASRDTTTTPVQSLLLANSAALRTRSRAFAQRLKDSASNTDPESRIRLAWQLAYARNASEMEVESALRFLSTQAALADSNRLASGQANFVPGKVPYRDGQAAMFDPAGSQSMLTVNESESLQPGETFTIEAFFVPRSVSEGAELRTIASKWSGRMTEPGWSLGITGQKSRRRPLSIALQFVGRHRDGTMHEHPVFSDLSVQINKPYFIGAAFTPATTNGNGRVLFALKDLSNDDEPLLLSTVEHEITGGFANSIPLTIGARFDSSRQSFHGVIDDVRLSSVALPPERMLHTSESIGTSTLGYWKFEPRPDVFQDSSGHGRSLSRPAVTKSPAMSPESAALADLCNALLNSSEFLYIE